MWYVDIWWGTIQRPQAQNVVLWSFSLILAITLLQTARTPLTSPAQPACRHLCPEGHTPSSQSFLKEQAVTTFHPYWHLDSHCRPSHHLLITCCSFILWKVAWCLHRSSKPVLAKPVVSSALQGPNYIFSRGSEPSSSLFFFRYSLSALGYHTEFLYIL